MTADQSLRHVEALVNQCISNSDTEDLLRRGLKAFLAVLMEAEVTELSGAAFGERSDERVTKRNGYRERRFDTPVGTVGLEIPKLRQGTYFPSFLTARRRSDEALIHAIVTCYQQGVSTRNVEAVVRTLGIESLSKSTVSEMVKRLDPQIKAFRERALPACPYVYLDARYEMVREDHHVKKVAVLIAIGVRKDGLREVLGLAVARVENEPYWGDLLADLVDRGLREVKLVISDAHEGLRKAIGKQLPGALWQRCRVHFIRNLSGRVSKRHRPTVLALAKTVFAQESFDAAVAQRKAVVDLLRNGGQPDAAEFLEGTDEVLTFMQFPYEHWTKLHSTNCIERLNRELKRRTRVVSIFPNRASIVRLVGALLLEEHEEWLVGRRYISERSMKLLEAPLEAIEASVPGASKLLVAK